MKILSNIFFALVLLAIACPSAFSQNPILRDQFSADPSARVFNGKIYVFPSHDIVAPEDKGLRENWFCMEDYHVFSSENLTDWTDHGMIVSQYDVEWVDSKSYSMWAPDCVERNGKYYFYFPSNVKPDGEAGRRGGFGIGVAIADAPEGLYVPQEKPIQGINGIDPNILIDDDGQAYIYWSMGNIYGAKLSENMLELESEVVTIAEMPRAGMKEGPWAFKRNGLYYMTLPHVAENVTERLEYGISDSPLGPFEMKGVVMDESPTGCWTNHHSILEYKDQWYLFYHHNDYSPDFDKNRSVRADSLFFNPDGTIQKVIPTLRGIGLASAESQIQLDRYTDISENAAIDFINPENTFEGWKTIFKSKGDWVRFNSVDFSNKKLKKAKMRVRSESGGKVQIKFDNKGESVLAEVEIPKSDKWVLVDSKIEKFKKGTYDLNVELISGNNVEIDWVQFAK